MCRVQKRTTQTHKQQTDKPTNREKQTQYSERLSRVVLDDKRKNRLSVPRVQKRYIETHETA